MKYCMAILFVCLSSMFALVAANEAMPDKVFVSKMKIKRQAETAEEAQRFMVLSTPSWAVQSSVIGNWASAGEPYGCSSWAPPQSLVDWGDSYTQTRTCEQDQVRTISQVLFSDRLGETRQGEPIQESQTISIQQSQQSVGTLDFVVRERLADWIDWQGTGGLSNCSEFIPSEFTVASGVPFTQTSNCEQNQTRTREVFNVFASGAEVLLRTDSESRIGNVEQSREAIGAERFVVRQVSVNGAWSAISPSCGGFSPKASDVLSGTSFTQTRNCTSRQFRPVTIYDEYNTGELVQVSQSGEFRNTGSYVDSRSATGSMTVSATFQRTSLARNCYLSGSVEKIDVATYTVTRYSNGSETNGPSSISSLSFTPATSSTVGASDCQRYVFNYF